MEEPFEKSFSTELDKGLDLLSTRDWQLFPKNRNGFSSKEMRVSSVLLTAFSKGVVDTITDQRLRRLVVPFYVLPKVKVSSLPCAGSYDWDENKILVGREELKYCSKKSLSEMYEATMSSYDAVVFRGTMEEYYYTIGCHEAKHSVDYFADKLVEEYVDPEGLGLEKYLSIDEYRALGVQALMSKKIDPFSESTISLLQFLNVVIEYRRLTLIA